MAKTSDWKYKAKKQCEYKGLYNMTSKEKVDLCQDFFDKMNKINIDKENANKIFSTLRGRE